MPILCSRIIVCFDSFPFPSVDSDPSLNSANWMWLSASAFFHQYWRIYSPITFGQKYDPDGQFIRHFLPVLKNMPSKYIYSPWAAPLDVQKRAGCIIGADYPRPIVDHQVVSRINMEKHKQAYSVDSKSTSEEEEKEIQSKKETKKRKRS
jgi:cryptochrome